MAAAQRAGLKVKINAVALKGVNEDELADMVAWSHDRGMEITFIEVMPLGEEGGDRSDQFLSLEEVRHRLAERFTLEPLSVSTGGPARYARVAETGGRVGFITPLTHNFCESCNRVRVTCTGTLYMCLGQNDAADLRAALRSADPGRGARRRHRGGHLAQAEGPRLRRRPPRRQAARRPDDEHDGGLRASPGWKAALASGPKHQSGQFPSTISDRRRILLVRRLRGHSCGMKPDGGAQLPDRVEVQAVARASFEHTPSQVVHHHRAPDQGPSIRSIAPVTVVVRPAPGPAMAADRRGLVQEHDPLGAARGPLGISLACEEAVPATRLGHTSAR